MTPRDPPRVFLERSNRLRPRAVAHSLESLGRLPGNRVRRVRRAPPASRCAEPRPAARAKRRRHLEQHASVRVVRRGSAPRSARLGRDHRRIHQRGLARRDLRQLLYREIAARCRSGPSPRRSPASTASNALFGPLQIRHVRIGQSREARANAEPRQYGDRDDGSDQREMPEQPHHGGRGQRQNCQERSDIRPRVRRRRSCLTPPESSQCSQAPYTGCIAKRPYSKDP